MQKNYYLALVKNSLSVEEYPVRIEPKGFLGMNYNYSLKTQTFYASKLTHLGARIHKLIYPVFVFKDENGLRCKPKHLGHVVIRKF